MNPVLLTRPGFTEAVIDDNCGLKRFYFIANYLAEKLRIRFIKKSDDIESLLWEFTYKHQSLMLHYDIYSGISIYPTSFTRADRRENQAVIEIASFLLRNLEPNSSKEVA